MPSARDTWNMSRQFSFETRTLEASRVHSSKETSTHAVPLVPAALYIRGQDAPRHVLANTLCLRIVSSSDVSCYGGSWFPICKTHSAPIGDACLRSNEFKLLEALFQLTEYIVRRHSSGLD